jgi:hypothetical protein
VIRDSIEDVATRKSKPRAMRRGARRSSDIVEFCRMNRVDLELLPERRMTTCAPTPMSIDRLDCDNYVGDKFPRRGRRTSRFHRKAAARSLKLPCKSDTNVMPCAGAAHHCGDSRSARRFCRTFLIGAALAGRRSDALMLLRKLFAALLLLLTASPFTAPFATCDVAALLSDRQPLPPEPFAVAAAVEDGSHGVPLCAASSGIRTRIKIISRSIASKGATGPALSIPRAVRPASVQSDRSVTPALSSLRI